MEKRTKIHVGLDVHKDSITVAAAEPGRDKARLVGKVVHDVPKVLKVLTKLSTVDELHIVYEAGPTGYGLQRALAARGYTCEVIAPSKTPRQPGQRVKADARDSLDLAEYSRAGTLTPVWIPDPEDEAIRTIAWKGQLRLTSRYAALSKRGIQANKVCVAVARELAGFVWAIGMHAQREKAAT